MAEASPSIESKIMCRYFVHGVCKKGDNCNYSHDRQSPMDNVCKFYLQGNCAYADRCRYFHTKPKVQGNKASLTTTQVKTTPLSSKLFTSPSIPDDKNPSSGMVSLKKALGKEKNTPTTPKPPELWVQASEFVPGQPYKCSSIPNSYAHAASNGVDPSKSLSFKDGDSGPLLCPFSTNKPCPYGEDCEYIHGEVCELCGLAVLVPGDSKQNEQHRKECTDQHEAEMERAFAVARSKDKQCGICMDVVLDKEPPTERRFGILSDCSHCFCLACIRKWRASKQFDNKTIRSCPECRVQSDFVTPSQYWVDTKDEKIKVIQSYKSALSTKPCKYFNEGRGDCPFNDRCFYLHLNPDGTKAEPRPRRRRQRRNVDGELDLEERVTLWDFFSDRQERLEQFMLLLEDDLASLIFNLNFFSDSDDSDDEYLLY